MKKVMVMLSLALTAMCGTVAAEQVTGRVERSVDEGEVYYRLCDPAMDFLVGCASDVELTPQMRDYLSKNEGETVTVHGLVIDHPRWGFCIDSPELTGGEHAQEPVPLEDTPSVIALPDGYEWLRIESGLTDEERAEVEKLLAGNYYDPEIGAPLHSFLGVCQFFHDGGYSVEVEHEFVRWTEPEEGVEGQGVVTVTVIETLPGFALRFQLVSLAEHQGIAADIKERTGVGSCQSILDMSTVAQMDPYPYGEWIPLSSFDWVAVMRPIVERGYLEELGGR